MESLLVVGGDNIDKITKKLEGRGFKEIIHLDGRKKQMSKKEIPTKVGLILILTDYINHNLSNMIKRRAQENAIPICFAKRSWCAIDSELRKREKLLTS
ncbi:DUF2325 domain-containing protein [Metabacillus fastidiosus]|uniref:DUF2325 domain-containing protein n=1 Tax=Metabacillus fastidiosus TaxID=1458 RepID=A0ABU6P1E6_9BACI|nr:DUF2325 domain-containing protein [Metabacillus fastidiosus]MEC2075081.1 DUF2325 domain-containing protein [Metabacillus fastidiosus]MED4401966.1 DUF2325 domain-containing protein [Metabacillus fastidiosus]MED4454683.1 DUF2325 domain-containing protein [Metabacillus fastidiosus]MED4460901.1 DUF2325 domain-containing protein [Metabacillus fastidiosus]